LANGQVYPTCRRLGGMYVVHSVILGCYLPYIEHICRFTA